jgi:hypothetical protein
VIGASVRSSSTFVGFCWVWDAGWCSDGVSAVGEPGVCVGERLLTNRYDRRLYEAQHCAALRFASGARHG